MDNESNKDTWALEPDDIDADNINPEIPKELWDSLAWKAIRVAIETSDAKEEVLRRVKKWNTHNNPRMPEKQLVQKSLWAMRNWENKFTTAG